MMKKFFLLTLCMMLAVSLNKNDKIQAMPSKRLADFSNPKRTYLTYLYAVKQNDLELAKQCWIFSEENTDSILDVLVGTWVTHHYFNEIVVSKFHEKGKQFIRGDCTDTAIDRTIERVEDSSTTISGNRAELMIAWQKGDGFPVEVFHYTPDEPIIFRKVNDKWKIDANEMTGLKDGSSEAIFFDPCGIGALMRSEKNILEELIQELKEDRITTPEALEKAWKHKVNELMKMKQSLDCIEKPHL